MKKLLLVALFFAVGAMGTLSAAAAEPPPVTKANVYQTDKYGNKLGQAFEVKGDKVYSTDRYGNKTGQVYAVKDKTPPAPPKK